MEMKLKTWTSAIILSLFISVIFSLGCIEENRSAEEIVAGMEKKQKEMTKEINDMSFTEVITVSIGNESRTNESEVLYKRPKKYKRIENIDSAITTIFVTNGTVMWIYKPQEKSVRILNIPSEDFVPLTYYAETINFMLNNNKAEYKGTELVDNRKAHKIMLVPKKQQDNFSYWFWLDDKTGLLLKIQTYRDGEPEMTLEHRNFEINMGIQGSEFEFEIPEGVKVIRRDGRNISHH
ncbi:MAG: outer membrane lipoprotein carrier protein LolA [Methanophagales archaeon]|nr:outer membrane lipoprotein carrier protein LolA [Methanophagales archaeon]